MNGEVEEKESDVVGARKEDKAKTERRVSDGSLTREKRKKSERSDSREGLRVDARRPQHTTESLSFEDEAPRGKRSPGRRNR